MNLTSISGQQSSTWKNLKTRYVIAAAGAALALSAVIAAAPWQHNAMLVTAAPSVASSFVSQGTPTQVIHIVATEAERLGLIAETSDKVIVSGSAEEQILYTHAITDMMNAGVDYRIVDTTRPAVVTTQRVQAHQANIMASVISTERANYSDGTLTPSLSSSAVDADRAAYVTAQEQYMVGLGAGSPAVPSPRVIDAELAAYATELEQYMVAVENARGEVPTTNRSIAPTPATVSAAEAGLYEFGQLSPDTGASVGEAHILASVISTENAQYGM
jgi:hypothetical protein